MKVLRIILIIALFILLAFLSFIMYQSIFFFNSEIIVGLLSLLTAITPLIIKEVVKHYNSKSKKDNPSDKSTDIKLFESGENTFNMLIFGSSGSGKTTFIKNLFEFNSLPIKSTKNFDFHSYHIHVNVNDCKKSNLHVQIADYKGQKYSQFFELARHNSDINAIFFIVDVAPAYNKTNEKLSDEQILEIYSSNFENELANRINFNHRYINENSIPAVFDYASSDDLKSVRFLINKIDILEELKTKQLIDSDLNVEQCILDYYSEIIEHLKKSCEINDIVDFKTILISAKKNKNTKEMFTDLATKFTEKLKQSRK